MNLYIKALHIIFVVTWFAGLFYIVRLFVYHSEAELMNNPEKEILQKQYKLMQKRLWYGIAWPSMILTLLFGGWMVVEVPQLLQQSYFLVKLFLVAGLILYHMQCHRMFRKYQSDLVLYSSFKMRMWNEVATLFLFAIVFIIVLKSNTDFVYGILAMLLLVVTLYGAIQLYKKQREK